VEVRATAILASNFTLVLISLDEYHGAREADSASVALGLLERRWLARCAFVGEFVSSRRRSGSLVACGAVHRVRISRGRSDEDKRSVDHAA